MTAAAICQVVVAWIFDVPLTLDFQPFETATVFLSVIIVNVIMANGKSTYLDGLILLALYLFISLGFIMHDPEEAHCIQDQLWCVHCSIDLCARVRADANVVRSCAVAYA